MYRAIVALQMRDTPSLSRVIRLRATVHTATLTWVRGKSTFGRRGERIADLDIHIANEKR